VLDGHSRAVWKVMVSAVKTALEFGPPTQSPQHPAMPLGGALVVSVAAEDLLEFGTCSDVIATRGEDPCRFEPHIEVVRSPCPGHLDELFDTVEVDT